MNFELQLVQVPASDVDRAKSFYVEQAGFNADLVSDIHAARDELAGRGVEVSDVQEFPWGSFVFFSDPDGNSWAVQAIPPRE